MKHVNAIAEDEKGNLWIGTNEHGVCKYNPKTENADFLLYDLMKSKNQILSNSVNAIAIDSNYIWIGTSVAGLSRYDMSNGSFEDYTAENGKLSNNNIFALKVDHRGGVWIGTNWGLNYINPNTGKILQYTEKDGLPNAAISGIEIDAQNHLWISTYYGLSHYNPQRNKFTNYYTSDGLVNNEFRRGAYFQSISGEIFFGGINGLTFFYPFESQPSYNLSNLIFTDLFIYNEPVIPGESGSILMIVLSGMVVGALFTAFVGIVKFAADPQDALPSITFWIMGSLTGAGLPQILASLPLLVIGSAVLLLLRWRLNILALPADEAASFGVNTQALRWTVILAATVVTASVVSICGLIGWVGLLVPHAARMLFGSANERVLPACLLLGGLILMLIDTAARSLKETEIPVSILSAFVVAPVVILLLSGTGGRFGYRGPPDANRSSQRCLSLP